MMASSLPCSLSSPALVRIGVCGLPASRIWMRTSPGWEVVSTAMLKLPPGWPDRLCATALLTSSETIRVAS
jgi:hypothetical protein